MRKRIEQSLRLSLQAGSQAGGTTAVSSTSSPVASGTVVSPGSITVAVTPLAASASWVALICLASASRPLSA